MFIAACDSQKGQNGLRHWQSLIDLPITSTGTHLHRLEHNDGIVDGQTQPPLWQWSLHSSSASGFEVCGGRAFKTGGRWAMGIDYSGNKQTAMLQSFSYMCVMIFSVQTD